MEDFRLLAAQLREATESARQHIAQARRSCAEAVEAVRNAEATLAQCLADREKYAASVSDRNAYERKA
jgi:phage shock protein A